MPDVALCFLTIKYVSVIINVTFNLCYVKFYSES
jgi:hypothetical protein